MAAKTDKKANTLPQNTNDLTPSSSIAYNNEVVAIIAGLAANEVEGIAGMCAVGGSLKSKNRNVTKGVKVEVGTEEVAVDLYVIVEYGIPIQRAAADAQENVRKAIESMTGLHVVRVDVHVQSVSFEQEKKALQAGAQNAALAAGETEPEKLPEKKQEKLPEKKPEKLPEKKEEKAAEKPAAQPELQPVKAEEPKETPKQKAVPKAKAEPKAKAAKAEKKTAPESKARKDEEKKQDGEAAPEA